MDDGDSPDDTTPPLYQQNFRVKHKPYFWV